MNFDKTLLINLERSLSKEMIRTNRAGAYNSTTLIDCNTRKYHGLLVLPLTGELPEDNYVLLDKSPVFKSAVKRDSATPVHIDNNTLLKNDVIRYVTYDKRSDLTINELVDRCDKYVARYGVDYNAKDRN